jgi:hypothetical protein
MLLVLSLSGVITLVEGVILSETAVVLGHCLLEAILREPGIYT